MSAAADPDPDASAPASSVRFRFVGGRQASEPRLECVLLGAEESALLELPLLLLPEPRLRGGRERAKLVELRFGLVVLVQVSQKRGGGAHFFFF